MTDNTAVFDKRLDFVQVPLRQTGFCGQDSFLGFWLTVELIEIESGVGRTT
ncbi:hypothetical protein PSSHI_42460 [Photobacterium sp. R1]